MGKHLLIISCSGKKSHQLRVMPAIDRYKGAWYGVINKLKREQRMPDNVDILIISAKYGLIKSDDMIEDYDWKMDMPRARELNDQVLIKLKNIFTDYPIEGILVNLGSAYMEAIRGIESIKPESTRIIYLEGIIGKRKKGLRDWLLSISD
jgi:cytoplasmic iron level regulating protein YaaA (DUF328/UPF0246 family)